MDGHSHAHSRVESIEIEGAKHQDDAATAMWVNLKILLSPSILFPLLLVEPLPQQEQSRRRSHRGRPAHARGKRTGEMVALLRGVLGRRGMAEGSPQLMLARGFLDGYYYCCCWLAPDSAAAVEADTLRASTAPGSPSTR